MCEADLESVLRLQTWALAGATGPMIGAATAQTDWRWLFRMNYPATIIIAIPVWAFLT